MRLGLESGFNAVNYPNGYKVKPWCPFTETVELGAQLAGLPVDPEKFCGQVMENAVYSHGLIPLLESADLSPRVTCLSAHMQLIQQLRRVEGAGDKPDEKKTRRALASTHSLGGKGEILDHYRNVKKKAETRAQILSRWRRVLLEEGGKSTENQPSHHFENRRPDQVTDNEVIEMVQQIEVGLKRITGYEPRVISLRGGAQHCSQSPRYESLGKY